MSWREATLQDLVYFQRGFDITRDQQKPGDIPVISSSGITSFHNEAMADGPGVIIGRKGSLGTTHYSEGPYWPHDTTLWSKDLRGNCAKYVFYFLQTLRLQQFNVGNANPTLNRNHIHGLDIHIPPLDVQRRIADVLSDYDDLIENNRRRIQLVEESARLLYREWFVHLRFPGHEHVRVVDGVPEGWERKLLSELAEINATSLTSKFDGEIEYIDIASVTKGSISDTTAYAFEDAPSRARRVVRHGDMIWSCVRPNRESYALIWNPPENLIASTGFAIISPHRIGSAFLYHALSTPDFVGYLANNAKGAAYPAVVAKDFADYQVMVPSQSLLNDFESNVMASIALAESLKVQNKKLAQARDLLLPRLMSGELPV